MQLAAVGSPCPAVLSPEQGRCPSSAVVAMAGLLLRTIAAVSGPWR